MSKPVFTMARLDHPRRPLGCMTKGGPRPRSDGADPFLDQAPPRFDGIEVVGVRRQVFQAGPGTFDERPHHAGLMGRQVVQHHDVATPQHGTSRQVIH